MQDDKSQAIGDRRQTTEICRLSAVVCRLCLSAVIFFLISACSTADASPRAKPITATSKAVAGERVSVRPGDTIYGIARRYGVSMSELIAVNHLRPPYRLEAGMSLNLPAQRIIEAVPPGENKDMNTTVISGDTKTKSTAAYFDESGKSGEVIYSQKAPETAQAKEPLQKPRAKVTGKSVEKTPEKVTEKEIDDQIIYVPAKSAAIPMPASTHAPPAVSPPEEKPIFEKQAEALQAREEVKERLKKQIKKPDITVDEPVLPPPGEVAAVPEKDDEKKQPLKAPRAKEEKKSSTSAVVAAAAAAAKPLPAGEDEAARKSRFIWPVRGPVLSSYGPKSNGLRNDGMNIGAPRGTPVVAADSGTVAYAGSEIPGFGNVVLVRHASGLMTTYAHLDRLFVQRDDVVARGDVLGAVGTSGGLDTPQLHFEIRHEKRALDPAKYLYAR